MALAKAKSKEEQTPDYDSTHSNSPAADTFSRSLSFLGSIW